MRNLLRGAFVLLCAAFVLSVPAAGASSLDDHKAAGHIGERPDGKIGVVHPGAPATAKALVDEVNTKRQQSYAKIARENGVPVDAIAAQAGAKLIERTPPGQYVMRDGGWMRK